MQKQTGEKGLACVVVSRRGVDSIPGKRMPPWLLLVSGKRAKVLGLLVILITREGGMTLVFELEPLSLVFLQMFQPLFLFSRGRGHGFCCC